MSQQTAVSRQARMSAATDGRPDAPLRIDQAHSARGPLAPQAATGDSSDSEPGQDLKLLHEPAAADPAAEMQTQARQIATHLAAERDRLAAHEAELEAEREFQKRAEDAAQDDTERRRQRWEELLQACEEHEQQVRRDRQALADELTRNQDHFERRRRELDRRGEALDGREADLRLRQQVVLDAEREALELRVATEELWGQLVAALPPAAVERSVGRLRQRLKENFRLAAADLDERRAELAALHVRLEQQHESLSKKRSASVQWAARREAELHETAEQLALREEEVVQSRRLLAAARERIGP